MSLKLKWTKPLDFKDFMKECKKPEIFDKIAKVKYATYIKTNGHKPNPDIMGVLSKILERLDRVEINQKSMQGQIDKNQQEIKHDIIEIKTAQQEMRVEFNNRIDNIVMMNNLKE